MTIPTTIVRKGEAEKEEQDIGHFERNQSKSLKR